MATKKTETVSIKPLKIEVLQARIVGDTPLIMHQWSEKAKRQLLDKMMKVASTGREVKDPEAEYRASLYYLELGGYGFPATGIKAAMVRAAKGMGMVMKDMQCAIFVEPDDTTLVRLHGEPVMREDIVRVANGAPDLRYRGEFKSWFMDLTIKYNAAVVSADQVINMLNGAGFGVGIGEWRMEKGGQYGSFHVEIGRASCRERV